MSEMQETEKHKRRDNRSNCCQLRHPFGLSPGGIWLPLAPESRRSTQTRLPDDDNFDRADGDVEDCAPHIDRVDGGASENIGDVDQCLTR